MNIHRSLRPHEDFPEKLPAKNAINLRYYEEVKIYRNIDYQ